MRDLFLSAGWDGHIKLWNMAQNSPLNEIHDSNMHHTSLLYIHDSKTIFSSGGDEKIFMWIVEKN